MITIRKHMDIVIFHARQIQRIQEVETVLEMDVVVADAVQEEETRGLGERGHVVDGVGGVVGVVRGGEHVAFCVDGVCGVRGGD